MNGFVRSLVTMLVIIGLVIFGSTSVFSQSTAPSGFCTVAPPDNPGWQVSGTVSLPSGCPVSGNYAMSMRGSVTRYAGWTELNSARGNASATLYFEGAAAEPVSAVQPEVTPIAPVAVQLVQPVVTTGDSHIERLAALDPIYRTQGWQAWLSAAGVVCGQGTVEARQPEEETLSVNGESRILVAGIQVRGSCSVPWPNIVTSDRPGEITKNANTIQYQPDARNASILYTNVSFNGQGTVWVDASNWGQFSSQLPVANAPALAPTQPVVDQPVVATPVAAPPVVQKLQDSQVDPAPAQGSWITDVNSWLGWVCFIGFLLIVGLIGILLGVWWYDRRNNRRTVYNVVPDPDKHR